LKKFVIYQLKDIQGSSPDAMLAFRGWDANNTRFDFAQYICIWSGERVEEVTLDDFFVEFNCFHPQDFHGHSLSVSDIVQVNGEYWFCDSVGWVNVTYGRNVKITNRRE